MTISLSDKALAIAQLSQELEQLEALQLQTGERMASLIADQLRLAEKTRAIMNTMERIIHEPR